MQKEQLAGMIDHAILHPTQGLEALKTECAIADKYQVASVCVKPYAVKEAVALLKDSKVMVGTVIGFPHGNSSLAVKVAEAEQACDDGAEEIDMVVNNGKVTDADWDYVLEEISAVNQAVMAKGALVKVIFENAYLQDEQIIKLCELCSQAKVAFVKTSTGFGFIKAESGDMKALGATAHHVELMRQHSDATVEVKAAGGIKTMDDMIRLNALGATRFGTSSTQVILEGYENKGAY